MGFMLQRIGRGFSISFFTVNTLARSFLTGTKGHNAIKGCHKCNQQGVSMNRRIVFSTEVGELRTDNNFTDRVFPDHHLPQFLYSHNVLEHLYIGNISQIPNEPMHLLDLGVTKKMLLHITRPRAATAANVAEMSVRLISLAGFIPKEFARKPRTLEEIHRWKSTEFRQFILYTGPIVLKNLISNELYQHFLTFTCAYRLICSDNAINNAETAQNLFTNFVQSFPNFYGIDKVSYNVYNLLHIADSVLIFGNINNFSAYKFENYMQEIKKHVRKSNKILQQITNRITEIDSFNVGVSNMGLIFCNNSSEPFLGCVSTYRGYKFNKFIFKNT